MFIGWLTDFTNAEVSFFARNYMHSNNHLYVMTMIMCKWL